MLPTPRRIMILTVGELYSHIGHLFSETVAPPNFQPQKRTEESAQISRSLVEATRSNSIYYAGVSSVCQQVHILPGLCPTVGYLHKHPSIIYFEKLLTPYSGRFLKYARLFTNLSLGSQFHLFTYSFTGRNFLHLNVFIYRIYCLELQFT